MWGKHWTLKEGFTIGSGLIVTGLLLQFTIGPVIWGAFRWPANIITLAIFVLFLIIAYAIKDRVALIKFGLSYASAVPAITFAVVLTIIMGLTRQSNSPAEEDPLGITSCLTFWPFVLIYIWVAWIVGFTAIHQVVRLSGYKVIRSEEAGPSKPQDLKTSKSSVTYVASLVSHLGLFIVLVCGTLGSADMQRLKVFCEPGKPEWRGLDQANQVHELPIAIQLDSFIIEEYPPKLTLVENKTMQAVDYHGKPLSVLLDKDFKGADMGGWHITYEQIIDDAAPKMTMDTTVYVNWPVNGACTAVLVTAAKGKVTKRGWVTCGSYRLPSQMMNLDNKYSIGMSQREPKRFASKINVFSQEGDNVETIVDVNRPFTLMGYKIYQYSYNEQMGKWSNYSVFEVVSDPWLPVVYTGIGLIALGAMGLFFTPKRKEDDNVG